MTDRHTVRSYDEDLKGLTATILEMGALAESQFARAAKAMATRDTALAREVIEGDARVDALERDVNERSIRLLALRQPMADDLRYIISGFKISADLERIGDYAANLGKRVLVLDRLPETPLVRELEPMADMALVMLRDTLQAYRDRDIDRAMDAWNQDEPLDDLYDVVVKKMSGVMMEDPSLIGACAHLMFIARNIERIGDHATNIAENIYFFISGLPLRMVHPKPAPTTVETDTPDGPETE
ncbi:phosphate signaling complex protein PhoU [Phaeovibrio sulfidiphilus]|uniref:Phosphate-specific transport system accessory protein PhoU n=1 Tax=Phaeovibrio sulfidiphilus TaxID=1220600 RepID=A0A8J6YL38_9PROT|nr:phosphate signaling complex protein PhoU [Phaeovibrio sulfidiphilus]MBE1236670.1 phosphate signaling complex protein PhoU [Phaeovibrio sulfidiphilus]